MRIGVLAIQGAVSEHLAMLESCGAAAQPVRSRQELANVAGLILPGGESTTIGRLLSLFGLDEDIRKRGEKGTLALFGTCAGMVLLAERVSDGLKDQRGLGLMDMTVRRNAFGRQKESFEAPLLFSGLASPFPGVFIRAPLATELSAGVQNLAELPEGIIAARQDNLLAISFHPELTGDTRLHDYFIHICRGL